LNIAAIGVTGGTPEGTMPLTREFGTILQWFGDRGFGFIAPDHGGRRIFVHAASFERHARMEVGQHVEYCTVVDAKGPRAVAVRAAEVAIPTIHNPTETP